MQIILDIKDLSLSLNGQTILSKLNLSLQKGDKIIICGPNGSGKTTLFKCILGLLKPQSGTIHNNADSIAYCKQDMPAKSFPISAEEVVRMGMKKNDKAEVEKAMTLTGTFNLKDRSYFRLSGGEKQRVSLARCLYQNSDMLLLDEPSSFLDEESRKTIINVLKNLPSDKTVIAVSHDEDFINNLSWPSMDIRSLCK